VSDPLLNSRIEIPDDVVRRRFAEESIVLNLTTGQYHGLNETAAAMLDALETGMSPADVVADISVRAGVPVDRVEADLVALLHALAERQLVKVHGLDDA
jgi:hypothetical protein